MTINSLGIAITTFVGQNFGARQYDRVRSGVRVCMAMAAGLTLLVSVSFYFGAEPLFRVFTQDNNVVAVGVQMMHVLTPVYITYISIEVLSGALRGCGGVFRLRPADAVADHDGPALSHDRHGRVQLPPDLDAGVAAVHPLLPARRLAETLHCEAGRTNLIVGATTGRPRPFAA